VPCFVRWLGATRARRRIGFASGQMTVLPLSLVALLSLAIIAAGQSLPGTNATAELQRGNYARAADLALAQLALNPGDETHAQVLLQTYLETGSYAEAESSARTFLSRKGSARVRLALAEALAATGRYQDAIAQLEQASREADRPDESTVRLQSDLRRGELLDMIGETERAHALFQSLVAYQNENSQLTAPALTAVARALAHLDRPKEANDLYLDAIAADQIFLPAHLGGGELFTERYNYAEAAEFFRDALAVNPHSAQAFVDIAANQRFGSETEMAAALARALEINPNLVAARTLRAAAALEAQRFEIATAELNAALKINPHSLEALSLRAALAYLRDQDVAGAVRTASLTTP
jgi:tetratricopeptide (TPR) repeat protein